MAEPSSLVTSRVIVLEPTGKLLKVLKISTLTFCPSGSTRLIPSADIPVSNDVPSAVAPAAFADEPEWLVVALNLTEVSLKGKRCLVGLHIGLKCRR